MRVTIGQVFASSKRAKCHGQNTTGYSKRCRSLKAFFCPKGFIIIAPRARSAQQREANLYDCGVRIDCGQSSTQVFIHCEMRKPENIQTFVQNEEVLNKSFTRMLSLRENSPDCSISTVIASSKVSVRIGSYEHWIHRKALSASRAVLPRWPTICVYISP